MEHWQTRVASNMKSWLSFLAMSRCTFYCWWSNKGGIVQFSVLKHAGAIYTKNDTSLLLPWIYHLAPYALLSWWTSTRPWNSPLFCSPSIMSRQDFFPCTEICFLNISGDCIDDLPARSTIWSLSWTKNHSALRLTRNSRDTEYPPNHKESPSTASRTEPIVSSWRSWTCLFLVLFQPSTNGYITTRDNKDMINIFHLLSSYLSAVDCCVVGGGMILPPPLFNLSHFLYFFSLLCLKIVFVKVNDIIVSTHQQLPSLNVAKPHPPVCHVYLYAPPRAMQLVP